MAQNTNSRPNIVFIFIESFDGRKIGFWGNPALKNATPHMDQIAREGCIFSNMYSTNPICCPVRANLWTGTYGFRHQSWNNHKGLKPGTKRFQHILEEEGYVFGSKKGGFGKHDYVDGRHTVMARTNAWVGPANIKLPSFRQKEPKVAQKWKFWMRKTNRKDWYSLRKAKRFLKRQAKNGAGNESNPFFLYLSLVLPHPKYYTHEKWLDNIDIDKIKIPKEDAHDHPVLKYQILNKNWQHGFGEEMVRKTRAIYYAMISETDAIIGEVNEHLKELGLDQNTYLFISADHGDNQLEHKQFYKMNMYESSVNMPLIINGPDVKQGQVYDEIVSTVDLAPTFLDIAGVPTENVVENYGMDFELDGESFLPLIRGEDQDMRDWAFSMFTASATNTSHFMVRKGDWKYIAFPGYTPQLFNLKEDPDEVYNVAEDNPEVVEELDNKLKEVVDYEKVHEEYVEYCKESLKKFEQQCKDGEITYRKWGDFIPKASFREVMEAVYIGWEDKHMKKLRNFMES